nr:GNAT family N-acetyltransferase [Methanocella sp. CWC-04]
MSRDFKKRYEEMSFEKRKEELQEKSRNGLLRVDMAIENDTDQCIGYCITSLCLEKGEKAGEIDSIYIEKDFRSMGIGDTFLERAEKWMDTGGAITKKVSIAAGNEDVLSFYGRYGYRPKFITLEQVKK